MIRAAIRIGGKIVIGFTGVDIVVQGMGLICIDMPDSDTGNMLSQLGTGEGVIESTGKTVEAMGVSLGRIQPGH